MNTKTNETQETPEVMSSSDSPSSYDIMAQNYDDWQQPLSSSAFPTIKLTWEHPEELGDSGSGASYAQMLYPKPTYSVYEVKALKIWKLRLLKMTCGVQIKIFSGGFKNPTIEHPSTQQEAVEAIDTLNTYQARAYKGAWHTIDASKAHEEHHKREMMGSFDFYFAYNKTQKFIESLTISSETYPDASEAQEWLELFAEPIVKSFYTDAVTYRKSLAHGAYSRPFCAGQAQLTAPTESTIDWAGRQGWTVSSYVETPGTIEPPCYLPPVSNGLPVTRSLGEPVSAVMPIELTIHSTENIRNKPVTLSFRNTGEIPIMILDTFEENILSCFLEVTIKAASGKTWVLCTGCADVEFCGLPVYRAIPSGGSYKISVPLGKIIKSEIWDALPTGAYTLAVTYHNQYGDNCLKGDLTTSCDVTIS